MELQREYSDLFRLTRSGKQTKLPSGFTQLRHQKITEQESPSFKIPGSIQERDRIIGKEKYFFQSQVERVRPYDPAIVGPGKRSTKTQDRIVTTSDESGSPRIKDNIPTQVEHNDFTPESTIRSSALWIQMAQFEEETQKELERLHEKYLRL
ncbi:hypothetical protein O181_129067 [Austropuccinia psidii MF-1]|uniref:Uncharacterized protein n=1 Tax=Austropuccinia psidii MF-1 TaxID=1389203 RepID=A0A9Q3L133_9BASI|nr:hypothetical protein [Austropuccinia psidii MF-1]